ncbi:MAG: TIGR03087 family PEP-CTERM/XrtA system glycosyltransferase [Planctomycetota bacterium]|nr:TIGR03087 family PEP-CTERM/XrtA system glycosyltransferase [Planctomycetota bacterium]
MKILFLSQRVPYPPDRGDKIASWHMIERMSRTHEVACVSFAHDDADLAAAEHLTGRGIPTTPIRHGERRKKLCALPLLATRKPLTLGVYGSGALQAEVDRQAVGADLIYAFSSSMGAFFLPHPELPRVMHIAELDSDKWLQYADRVRFPMSWIYRREGRTLLEFERRVAPLANVNVLCTPLEERLFRDRIPGASSCVLRNGVDLERFRPAPGAAETEHLIFTGVMNYYPNVEGCEFFVREVLPLVRRRHPRVRFSIVGSRPTPAVTRLAREPGVTVTGFVDDTGEWLRRASIAVAPLRIARGIQNKVLEAMATGLPTVGTSTATQGVGADDGRHYLVRDDATAFAEAVCDLLEADERARALGAAAREFVEEHYDWEVALAPLDELLETCYKEGPRES